MDYRYLFLVTTFCYGLASFLNRSVADKIHPYYMQMVIASTSITLVPLYLYLAKGSKSNINCDAYSIVVVVAATIISIIGSLIMFYATAKVSHSGSLGMIISIYPVISLILSVIFLHETINTQKIIAICLMIIGTILLTR